MKRFSVWIGTLCLSVFMVCGFQSITGHAGTMDLVSTLVDKLGITEAQAKGGSGALFQNAKDNLSADDFQKVSDAVPDMDGYLAAAPAVEEKSGLGGTLGSSLSSLGGGAAKAGSMLDLTSAFSKLGMDSGTLGKFVPVVLDFVQSKGGSSVAGLLKGLWK
jgi:hypothetical protein